MEYSKHEQLFIETSDQRAKKFCESMLHLFKSVATLGIYAGVKALQSHKTRGSAKFWKTREEIFRDKMHTSSMAINSTHKTLAQETKRRK